MVPQSIRIGDKTIIGTNTKTGDMQVWTYNHSTNSYTHCIALHAALEVDDHDHPALLVRASDSRILAFYCGHNSAYYYMRISTNPLDASAWGSEVDLDTAFGQTGYTYGMPIQLTGETNDPIYMFFRANNNDQCFSKSEDGGATWSAATIWLDDGVKRPYFIVAQNGDERIDISMISDNPNQDSNVSLYHGYYQGGNFYKSDGTLVGGIGDVPFAPSDFTQVYDGTGAPAIAYNLIVGPDNNPIIAYGAYPSLDDHRYHYARWNGTAWVDSEVCTAGWSLYGQSPSAEPYVSGGVSVDPVNPNVVYASRSVAGGPHQIWKYTTADGGATWDAGVQMTNGAAKAFRPILVRGATENPRLLYVTGTYTTYTNYDTTVVLTDA